MTQLTRRAARRFIPVFIVALALAHPGCGSKKKESNPAGPQVPAGTDEGRVRAMAVAPSLGAADPFAVLGGTTVTNTGPTVVNGDLGVAPGAAVTGFPPGIVNGTIEAATARALSAQSSNTAAFLALNQPCDANLTGQNLGGLTLTPGTYCFDTSAQLTGTLTLDGQGSGAAVWVFRVGSTLTTASNSTVSLINGAEACGVFWQIGSSATFGTNTTFRGNVLALTSITMNTGATSRGSMLARNGAVTLDSNVINQVGSCGGGGSGSPVPALPVGAGWALLAILLGGGAYVLSRP
jgi:hypothetical protein